MQKTKSFRELKRMAKLQMKGKMGTLIGAMAIVLLINLTITEIVSRVLPGSDFYSEILLQVISFIVELIFATLTAGLAYLHLHAACNMECKISDIFYVATNHPDKAIKLQAIISAVTLVLNIPTYYYNYNYGNKFINYYFSLVNAISANPNADLSPYLNYDIFELLGVSASTLFAWCIAIIICSIIIYIISLGFFPRFYLMLDFPSMNTMELLKESWKLMKGFKFRYFLLQLSFVPVIILSAFLFFIPLIWIIPYISMTNTNFYLDIIAVKNGSSSENEQVVL